MVLEEPEYSVESIQVDVALEEQEYPVDDMPQVENLQDWADRNQRALYRHMVITTCEAALAFLIMVYLAAWEEFLAVLHWSALAGFLSVMRCYTARNMLMRYKAKASREETSPADLDKLWKRLVWYQRLAIWIINAKSVLIVLLYAWCLTTTLTLLQLAALEQFAERGLEMAQVLIILFWCCLFLANAVIGTFGWVSACRSRRLHYANLVQPQSHLMPPAELQVIMYEDLMLKLSLDPESAAASKSSCAICLSEFEGPDTIADLPCGHYFHDSCARGWFQCQPRCPYRCQTSSTAILQSLRYSKGNMDLHGRGSGNLTGGREVQAPDVGFQRTGRILARLSQRA
mmetsp:Transcript_129330/g.234968  ORF Transcript_129330/g.234968 Transcript_129330/m.234968 type:complete len:344 (-) Transcript_129330:115-1146(-)